MLPIMSRAFISFGAPLSLLLLLAEMRLTRGQNSLDCNFDSGFCNWANDENDDFDWRTGSSVAIDGFHSIPRTLTGSASPPAEPHAGPRARSAGSFAYAQGRFRATPTSSAQAFLRSPEVSGLSSAATLSFVYWKTAFPPRLQVRRRGVSVRQPSADVEVCVQDSGAIQMRCLDTISGTGPQSWTQRFVTIPANPVAFNIVFVGTNFNSELDLIGIDDVTLRLSSANSDRRYAGSLLPSVFDADAAFPRPPLLRPASNAVDSPSPTLIRSQVPEAAQPGSTVGMRRRGSGASLAITDGQEAQSFLTAPGDNTRPGICLGLFCHFDFDLCRWENVHTADYNWKHKSRDGNSAGIVGDFSRRSSYVFVSGDTRDPYQRAVIKTDDFVMPADAKLEFYAYISEPSAGRLSVFYNYNGNTRPLAADDVLWQRVGSEGLGGVGWRRVQLDLPRVTSFPMAIIFVADGLSNANEYVGIDDVTLVNSANQEVGCASSFARLRKKPTADDLADSISTVDLSDNRLVAAALPSDQNTFKVPIIRKTPLRFSQVPTNGEPIGDDELDEAGFVVESVAPSRSLQLAPAESTLFRIRTDYADYDDEAIAAGLLDDLRVDGQRLRQAAAPNALRPIAPLGQTTAFSALQPIAPAPPPPPPPVGALLRPIEATVTRSNGHPPLTVVNKNFPAVVNAVSTQKLPQPYQLVPIRPYVNYITPTGQTSDVAALQNFATDFESIFGVPLTRLFDPAGADPFAPLPKQQFVDNPFAQFAQPKQQNGIDLILDSILGK